MISTRERRLTCLRTAAFDRTMVAVLSAFNLISCLYSLHMDNVIFTLSTLGSLALLFLPYVFEYVLSCRISKDLKLAYWFLVIGGPVLGNVYKFYHYIRPWDKLLHMLSGFLVAAVGYALPDFLLKEPPNKAFKCFFAITLSMAVGGIWEIYEYLLDVFFQMDMQNDTVITNISSYMLGETQGAIGEIRNIESVIINGTPLEQGYIDIGLIDTMKDMILCLMGAILCTITAALQKPNSRFATIRPA